MDCKPATKSRIPTATHKKEQKSDSTKPKLDNKEPPKTLKAKNNTVKPNTARSELNARTKISSEVLIAKKKVETATCSDTVASTLKNLKLKTQNNNVSPKEIGTLSKETTSGGTRVNRISKQATETPTSHVANAKEEMKKRKDTPRPIAAPKKNTIINQLWRVSKLARSRTEHGPNFGKAGSSSIPPPLKPVPNEKTRNANQDKEVAKNSVLTGIEACTALEKKVLPKETPADSRKPPVRSRSVRVPNMPPLERKAIKPIGSKPLKRSNTIHVFDSVPVRKLTAIVGENNDALDLEADQVPVANMENQLSPLLVGNEAAEVHVTPKKDIPHGGIPFKVHRAKKANSGVFNAQS